MKDNKLGGVYSTHGRDKCIKNLVEKSEGKRLLGRPRLIWVDKMDIRMWTGFTWSRIGTSSRALCTR
jgi:hypothetical protein